MEIIVSIPPLHFLKSRSSKLKAFRTCIGAHALHAWYELVTLNYCTTSRNWQQAGSCIPKLRDSMRECIT